MQHFTKLNVQLKYYRYIFICTQYLIDKTNYALKLCHVFYYVESKLAAVYSQCTKQNPGWKNMAAMPWSWWNMVMIKPWWRHGGHVSWHGYGVITIFSMMNTMIRVWSSCFPCFFSEEKRLFVSVFSNSYCHIPFIIWHIWLPSEEFTPPNWQISKI